MFSGTIALTIFLPIESVRASVIPVNNASFETGTLPIVCGANCFESVDPIPGWQAVLTGDFQSFFGQFQPGTQAGNLTYFSTLSDGITSAQAYHAIISQTVG